MAQDSKNPLLGNFSGPAENAPRRSVESSTPVSPKAVNPPDAISPPVQKVSTPVKPLQAEEELPETPEPTAEELYRKNLEDNKIPVALAREVLDDIFCKNCYEYSLKLAGKIPVTLRTRVGADTKRVLGHLEAMAPTLPIHSQDIIARFNVAASLLRYGDSTFDFPVRGVNGADVNTVETAFETRLNFLDTLAAPILERLIQEVHLFDRKMALITADGAPEDF